MIFLFTLIMCDTSFVPHTIGPTDLIRNSPVDIVLNVMAHGDAREGKLRGNRRMEWVGITLPLYLGTRFIQNYYLLAADPHPSTAKYSTELTPQPIQMDSSVSLKDQIWFLRVCHHV
jgi:hypothetical protein